MKKSTIVIILIILLLTAACATEHAKIEAGGCHEHMERKEIQSGDTLWLTVDTTYICRK